MAEQVSAATIWLGSAGNGHNYNFRVVDVQGPDIEIEFSVDGVDGSNQKVNLAPGASTTVDIHVPRRHAVIIRGVVKRDDEAGIIAFSGELILGGHAHVILRGGPIVEIPQSARLAQA